MKKAIMYGISAILVCSYLVILIKSFDTSKASDAYRKFYVTGEIDYYVSQEELETYRADVPMIYNNRGNITNRAQGWSYPEEQGIWTTGKQSDFYIYVDEPEKTYEMKIHAVRLAGYQNELYVNEIKQGDLLFDPDGNAVVTVKEGLVQGLNTFSIRTEDEVVPYYQIDPDSGDGRECNLWVDQMILQSK